MLREFFFHASLRTRAFAWTGLLVFVGHQLFRAWLKYAINDWYGRFYDTLQVRIDFGSGLVDEEVEDELERERRDVWLQLAWFCLLVSPAIVVHPLAHLIRNAWCLRWRVSLIEAYLEQWDPSAVPIEGASQRTHEDTQRFAAGVQGCSATMLESLLTLAIFCPVLYEIDPPLMWVALSCAVGGLLVSAIVGRKLVGLEVENQMCEAALRKQLVLLEAESEGTVEVAETGDAPVKHRGRFSGLIANLVGNYMRLFFNFAGLQTWLAFFEQAMVIVPYAVCAPRLFASDAASRFTLGTLMQATNSFSKVFDSMNVVSENWLAVNEFRSTTWRLVEFERRLRNAHCTVRAVVVSTTTDTEMGGLKDEQKL